MDGESYILVDGLIIRLSQLPDSIRDRLLRSTGTSCPQIPMSIIPTLGFNKIERILRHCR